MCIKRKLFTILVLMSVNVFAEVTSEQLKEYIKLADQGNADASNYLGEYFKQGNFVNSYDVSVTTKKIESFKFFKIAAEHGHISAQVNLGLCYYNGDGVTQDYEEAAKWWQKAANKGNADAENNLAIVYYNGRYYNGKGVAVRKIEAAQLWKSAASRGHTQAQISLGTCYYNGEGVLKDLIEAYAYWNIAAISDTTAKNKRNELEKFLSSSEVVSAQKRSQEILKEIEVNIAKKNIDK